MSIVRYEQQGAIVQITIDRPAQLNAINKGVRKVPYEAFERFEADENAYVGILTGSGGNAFCTGMDLKEAAPNALGDPPRGCLPIIGGSLTVTKPTIAAVNGVAYAGGWLFAQMCDLCLAAEHAAFGITEARVDRGMPRAAGSAACERRAVRALMELGRQA